MVTQALQACSAGALFTSISAGSPKGIGTWWVLPSLHPDHCNDHIPVCVCTEGGTSLCLSCPNRNPPS
jgi:hypothetical protein